MRLSNWIELAALLVILIVGITIKLKFRKKVSGMDGSMGIVKKPDPKNPQEKTDEHS